MSPALFPSPERRGESAPARVHGHSEVTEPCTQGVTIAAKACAVKRRAQLSGLRPTTIYSADLSTSGEQTKPRTQYVEEAIRLALDSRWDEAVAINREIIEHYGPDDQAQNRLGKALTELGRLEEARDAYDLGLKINPFNGVAKKNRSKLDVLIQHKDGIRSGTTKVDLSLFVEEMGKTIVTTLEGIDDPQVCDKVVSGDIGELKVARDSITIETMRGVRLGRLESKLARRIIKFIQGGNQYQAGIISCEAGSIRVIVRETYQAPAFVGKPSFPQRARREVAFRPYARESLVKRDVDIYRTDDDDDEEPLAAAAEEIDLAEEDASEVEEETEAGDFVAEADEDEDDDR